MNKRVVCKENGLQALAQPMSYENFAFHEGFKCPPGHETNKGYLVKYEEDESLTHKKWFSESEFNQLFTLEWELEGYLLKEKLNHQIKIQEHFARQGVDVGKLQDSPIVSELPELEIKYSDAVKSTVPTDDNQACASGSASSNDYQLNAKRENAFLVAQLLSNNKISAELRKKAETKMTALLDELI